MKLSAPGDSDQMTQISTLPNEVLGLVFQLAHRQACDGYGVGPDLSAPSQSSQRKIEVVISHVCNLWKEIALSSPHLWATFRVQRPAANQVSNKYQTLQVYLSRSGDADLDLFFDYVGVPVEYPTLMDMIYLIVPHLHRIKRLILLSDGTNFITPFYHQLTDASSPRLEHLEVSTGRFHNIRYEGADTELHWNPKILNVGPQTIKYLKLDASAVCRFRPPFQNLVHFTIEPGPARLELNLLWVCLEQILSLPHIETFSVWDHLFEKPDQWPARPMRPLDARRLKHVRIGNRWQRLLLFYLIFYVRAPLLESLTLVDVDLRRLDPSVTIQHTPVAAFPSFKTLYLVDVVVPPEGNLLKQLAFVTANAKNLSITTSRTYKGDHDVLLQELWEGSTPGADIPKFWPEVETLTINIPLKWSQSPDGLLHSCREYWGKLTTIRHPSATALLKWAEHGVLLDTDSGREIRTEEVGDVLTEYWPPDYDLFTQQLNREQDPFYMYVRQF